MSTVSSLSSNHSVTLPYPTYSKTQSILSINSSDESKEDILQNSNLSDNLFHRLSNQKRRLIQLYNSEIERLQSTSRLLTFINQIDQLLNEYESQQTTSGNQIKRLELKLFRVLNFQVIQLNRLMMFYIPLTSMVNLSIVFDS